jgi:hypothetical protein
MISRLVHKLIRNIASPYGLALISYGVFLFAWLLPENTYLTYLTEPDIMYHNSNLIEFYSLCVIGFLLGVWVFQRLNYFRFKRAQRTFDAGSSPLRFVLIPLIASTSLSIGSIIALGGRVTNLFSLVSNGEGQAVKDAMVSGLLNDGRWAYVSTIHLGVIWWAYQRSHDLRLRGIGKLVFRLVLLAAVLSEMVAATMEMDRTTLMPLIAGLFLIHIYFKIKRSKSAMTVLSTTILFGFLFCAMFIALSFLRGATDNRMLITSLLGYTAASYNRLAAELVGQLHYPSGGHGVYLSAFIAHNHTINRFIPFEEMMRGGTQRDVWLSEFGAVTASGLRAGFNWSGAFGFLFADLGWFTPIYLFGMGLLYGWAWLAFNRRGPIASIVYPWFAFCVLFWCGSNYLFDEKFVTLLVSAFALTGYEAMLLKKAKVFRPAVAPAARTTQAERGFGGFAGAHTSDPGASSGSAAGWSL